jgi:hypothetical protein
VMARMNQLVQMRAMAMAGRTKAKLEAAEIDQRAQRAKGIIVP